MRSAVAAERLLSARAALRRFPSDFVLKRFKEVSKKNKSSGVPDPVLRFALAAAITAAEERALHTKMGSSKEAAAGELQKFTWPARGRTDDEPPDRMDFMLGGGGGVDKVELLNADFREVHRRAVPRPPLHTRSHSARACAAAA